MAKEKEKRAKEQLSKLDERIAYYQKRFEEATPDSRFKTFAGEMVWRLKNMKQYARTGEYTYSSLYKYALAKATKIAGREPPKLIPYPKQPITTITTISQEIKTPPIKEPVVEEKPKTYEQEVEEGIVGPTPLGVYPVPSKLETAWDIMKEKISHLAGGLPAFDLRKEGIDYRYPPPTMVGEAVPTGLPVVKVTAQEIPITGEELEKRGYYEYLAGQESTYAASLEQAKLDKINEQKAREISADLVDKGQKDVELKKEALTNDVIAGKKTQKQAQIELNSYITSLNKNIAREFNSQHARAMKPYADAAQTRLRKSSKRILADLNKKIDKRDYGLVLASGALTGVGYAALTTIAPPLGYAAMGLGLAEAGIKRKEIAEYAKARPLSFGAGVAGMIAGGVVGGIGIGMIKGKIASAKFAKAAKTAKIKVIGIQTDVRTGFTQSIIGKTKILGKDYIIRVRAVGKAGKKVSAAVAKGEVYSLGKAGGLDILGYQTLGTTRAVGTGMKVRVGEVLTAKQLAGKGFVSKGVTRTIYDIEFRPRFAYDLTGAGLELARGELYPAAKFEPLPEMAGIAKTSKQITKFIMGEKQVKYKVTPTEYGWRYAPEALTFDPRISGFLIKGVKKPVIKFKPTKPAAPTTSQVAAIKLSQQQTAQVQNLLIGGVKVIGEKVVKVAAKPVISAPPITTAILGVKQDLGFGILQPPKTIQIPKKKMVQEERIGQQLSQLLVGTKERKEAAVRERVGVSFLQTLSPVTTIAQQQRQFQVQAQLPISRLAQQQVQKSAQALAFISPLGMPMPPITIPKAKYGFFPRLPTKKVRVARKPKVRQGWTAYGLKHSTKPTKRRWIKLNVTPYQTKRGAMNRGAYAVDRTLSNKFKVKKVSTRKTKKAPHVGYFKDTQHKFRDYKIRKGKKIPLDNIWIEKKGKPRIDTWGEKRGLTLARLLAPKKPRKKRRKKKKR